MSMYRNMPIRVSRSLASQLREYVAAEQERERNEPGTKSCLRTGTHLWMSLLADQIDEHFRAQPKVVQLRPEPPSAA